MPAVQQGAVIDGAARSDNVNSAGLTIDMEKKIHELEPDEYKMVALMKQFGQDRACLQMKHQWQEDRPIPNYSTISQTSAAGATTIYVNDYTRVQDDKILIVVDYLTGEIKERLLVQDTSIDEGVDVVAITDGSSGATNALAVGDIVVIGPESHAEGEDVPVAFTNRTIDLYTYNMQIDRAVKITDQEEAIAHYDSRQQSLAWSRKKAWIETMRDVNLLFYLATKERETTTGGGRRRYLCDGVFALFTENNIDLSETEGGFTEETLAGILAATKYFSGSSEKKILLGGSNAWRAISAWPKAALRVSPREKAWGIRLNEIITGFGDIDVGYDNSLNANVGLADRAVVLDVNLMRRLYLQSIGWFKMHQNIQGARDIHNKEDAISGTCGIMAPLSELYAQVSGIH
ncbi:MAG: hypothetical protein D4S01_01400 [Dehalococcoidia bacterium]|nr:MAG: hypothetical protein D4S01_01400 [Dehalococcoidia bacterium]